MIRLPIIVIYSVLAGVLAASAARAQTDADARARLTAIHAQIRILRADGNYQGAEPLCKDAVDLARKIYPDGHFQIDDHEQLLRWVRSAQKFPIEQQRELGRADELKYKYRRHFSRGELLQAEQTLVEQLATRERLLGENHKLTLNTIQFLGNTIQRQGRYATAELLHRRCIESMRESYGPAHSRTLTSAVNLGDLLVSQGRHADAERLLRDAFERAVQAKQGYVAMAAGINLAVARLGRGDWDGAGTVIAELQAIPSTSYLAPHRLDVTAQHLWAQGSEEAALELLQKHLSAERAPNEPLAERHSRRLDLVILQQRQGATDTVKSLRELAQTLERRHGLRHPETVRALRALGAGQLRQGAHPEAIETLERASTAFEEARVLAQYDGLDRAHFDVGLSPLPLLAAALATGGDTARAWEQLERGFARGLLDGLEQRSARPMPVADATELRRLHGRVQHVEEQLRRAESNGADRNEHRSQLAAALAAVRTELLEFEASQAALHDGTGRTRRLAELQAQLAPSAAYVAWLDLPEQGQHWAFLLQRTGAPVCVRIPFEPTTIDVLRDALQHSPTDTRARAADVVRRDPAAVAQKVKRVGELADAVYRQRLAPLRPFLEGVGKGPRVKQLVVLPSGVMAGVPIAVLTTEWQCSYAPSASVYATLQGRPPTKSTRVLAVGDPAGGAAAPIPLPGSRREVDTIAALLTDAPGRSNARCQRLLGTDATEAKLGQLQATDQLRSFSVLHFATHAMTDDVHPFRSCLLLGDSATAVPVSQLVHDNFPTDGRLTAAQIRYGWRLDADLVTLSACQTARGQDRGGEGVLGFSQALFLAGARALLLSQWPIDDRATTLLMARFYHNLWQQKLGKAAALHEAQQWLRSLPAHHVAFVHQAPAQRVRSEVPAPRSGEPCPFAHPYYWGAFVLVGAD